MSELTYERISSHFHLPINEASKELSVCATILKKVCRSLGIKRWPHRKIRSLDNMIAQLTEQLEETTNTQEISRIQSEIENFEKTKEYIINNPNISYKSVVPKSTLQSFSKSKTKNNSNNSTRFVVTPNSEELVLEVLTNLANQKESNFNNSINTTIINNNSIDVNNHVNNPPLVSSIPSSPEHVNFNFSPNSPPKPPLKKLILQRRKQEEEFLSHPPIFSVDNQNQINSLTVNNENSTTLQPLNNPLNHLNQTIKVDDHQINTSLEKENSTNNNIQIISFTSHSQPSKKRKLDEFEYEVPSLDEFRKYKSTFPNITYQRLFSEDSLVYISKSS